MKKISKKIYLFNMLLLLIVISIIFVYALVAHESLVSLTAIAQEQEEEDSLPPIIYNVVISDITSTSSVVAWNTNEPADSLVNYGLNKDYGVSRDPRADKLDHMILLDDLLPGRQYFFRLTSADKSGNQGISSDFSFTTAEDPVKLTDRPGYAEEVLEEGEGGLSEKGLEEILQAIESVTSEETLEIIEEKIEERAKEVTTPPTIILDLAKVEVGTDYAIIPWETDKESNTMVALAREEDYDENADDPYVWREGNSEEMTLEHIVEVNGLTPATVYHFQVSSESALGLIGYSQDRTFKTKSILPEIYNIQFYKIEEESATIKWTTNVPCSSIIEYTNLNSSETKLEGDSTFLTIHTLKLTNLIFDTYYSVIINAESEDGESAQSEPLTFITIRDREAPIIAKVNTESTIYPGSDNKIQTIASWESDEPAICQLFYHQGLVVIDEPDSLPQEEDYGTRHVQVITNFLPSTVYKFWIVCEDEAENSAKSQDFTMLTPTQEESIIDIIIKNFESSFGWLKKLSL